MRIKFIFMIEIVMYICCFIFIWLGMMEMKLVGWIAGMVILTLFAWFFLSGVKGVRDGKRMVADLLSISSMSHDDFKSIFKKKRDNFDDNVYCIAKYEIDGEIHYQLIQIKKIYGIVPGAKVDIYVNAHKEGVKTEYNMVTKWKLFENYCLGIPFVVELVGWIFLFVMRGL